MRRSKMVVAAPQPPLQRDDAARRAQTQLQLGLVDRLVEESIHLHRQRLLDSALGRPRRHHDDVHIIARRICAQVAYQIDPVEIGHLPVGDQHVEAAVLDRRQRQPAVRNAMDLASGFGQLKRHHLRQQFVVIGDENPQRRIQRHRPRPVQIGYISIHIAIRCPSADEPETLLRRGRPARHFPYTRT